MPNTPTRARGRSAVHGLAVATSVLSLLLIVAGGLVTSRDAGLAVPDWPLSFGMINPPRWYLIDNVRTEHGHRLIAFCVALATGVLAIQIRRKETRPAVRRLAAAAVAAVLLQALLGGLRVLELSIDLAMIHGWLGQMFFCLIVALTALTSPQWPLGDGPAVPAGLSRHSLLSIALVVFQLVLGIWIRHIGAGARPLLENPLFLIHVVVAALVVWAVLRLQRLVNTAGSRASRYIHRRTRLLVGLVCLQLGLGVATFAVTEFMSYDRQARPLESWLPTVHVAVGAVILATSVVIALHAFAQKALAHASMGSVDPETRRLAGAR